MSKNILILNDLQFKDITYVENILLTIKNSNLFLLKSNQNKIINQFFQDYNNINHNTVIIYENEQFNFDKILLLISKSDNKAVVLEPYLSLVDKIPIQTILSNRKPGFTNFKEFKPEKFEVTYAKLGIEKNKFQKRRHNSINVYKKKFKTKKKKNDTLRNPSNSSNSSNLEIEKYN